MKSYLLKVLVLLCCLNINIHANSLFFDLPWKDNCTPCELTTEIIVSKLKHDFSSVVDAKIVNQQLEVVLDPKLSAVEVSAIKTKIAENLNAEVSPYHYQDLTITVKKDCATCPIALQHVLNKFKKAHPKIVAVKVIGNNAHIVLPGITSQTQVQAMLLELHKQLRDSGIQTQSI